MVLENISTQMREKEFIASASSGALVKCAGKLVLMRRDDFPNIPDPNKLALLGGVMEKGETIIDTLKREMGEEIGVTIFDNQIQYLGILKEGNEAHTKNISLVELSPEQAKSIVKGKEGKSIEFFSPDNLPNKDELVPDLKVFFVYNKDSLIKWLNGENVTAEELGLKKEITD